MTKRQILKTFKESVSSGDLTKATKIFKQHPQTIADALNIPPKQSSINQRAKGVENTVSRYLWGIDRVWKDREDIRNDELRMVGEVKSAMPQGIWNRGGPFVILSLALAQLEEAVKDDPLKSQYMKFSVLVPVGIRDIGKALVMLEGSESITPLEQLKLFSSRITAIQQPGQPD